MHTTTSSSSSRFAPEPSSRQGRPRKRVLVVDAHPIVRHGLARLLQEEPDLEVVGAAATPEDAVRAVGAPPDVIMIGLVFREGGGLELIRRLRAACPTAPVLVLTAHPASLYAERAFRAGASGYVSKNAETGEIVRALRKVLEGGARVLEAAGEAAPEAGGAPRRLTEREVEVLEHIGRGLRSREIADAMGLSEKTIEGYRAQLRDKLNLPDAASLLQHAIRWVRLS